MRKGSIEESLEVSNSLQIKSIYTPSFSHQSTTNKTIKSVSTLALIDEYKIKKQVPVFKDTFDTTFCCFLFRLMLWFLSMKKKNKKRKI